MPVTRHPLDCADCCIRADGVSFAYNGHPVVRDVSFSVQCGDYMGIVGPNGGGKSTLLRLIVGIIEPTAGEIRVYGESPAESRHGGRIGYVPQRIVQSDFSFPATVAEIVASGRTPLSPLRIRQSREDDAAVREAMETAEIAHLCGRRITELSGGERQRVFIARALSSNPHMLILDEPTTGVDPAARDRFYALLRRLNTDRSMTILFVTHDVDVMVKEAKSILCINQSLLCHLPSHEFVHDDALQRAYGGGVEKIHHHH